MSAIANSMQFDNICRTCLSEEQNMKSIFDTDSSLDETLPLFQILMACTSVQVQKDDGLPAHMCFSCINYMARSFTFKKLCEESDATLREVLRISTMIVVAELKPSADVDADIDADPLDRGIKVEEGVQMDNICRTCLSEEQNMKSVFDHDFSSGETLQLFQMLMACTSVQVQEDDGLPAQMCFSCISYMARSFTLKKLCEKSDATLGEVLRKSTIIIDAELNPSSNVLLNNLLDEKVEFEEGEINVGDLFSGVSWTDRGRDDIKMMKNVDDPVPSTTECTSNEDTKSIVKENESEQPVYPCKECTASFTVENDLKIHSHTHQESPTRACTVNTPELASSANTLEDPTKLPSNDVNMKNTCNVCGRRFSRSNDFRRHLRTHTGEKPFVCKLCGRRFTASFGLSEHVRAHANEKNLICPVCGERFVRRRYLTLHQKTHTLTCNICGKQLNAVSLAKHMKTHTGVNDHVCSYCGKKFLAESKLRRHERVHTGEKPYVCDVCGNSYVAAGSLKRHKQMHTGKEPHRCHLCSKTFTRSEGLKIHIQRHTSEGHHICVHCKQSYHTLGELKAHTRLHTGEKPYKCKICDRSFSHYTSLFKHSISHGKLKKKNVRGQPM